MFHEPVDEPLRIGFVATRISGNDGVSLEIDKWSAMLERMGHSCFYISGKSDRPPARSFVIPEAHFKHPAIQEIQNQCFGREIRAPEVTRRIQRLSRKIKREVHAALKQFELDLLIAENCLTIPMNVPLGLALVETIMETGIGCIAHHHDFVWERERFLVNAIHDYLHTAFPPALPGVQHVVINTLAAREFSRHTGLSCRIIPNVMDFDEPPPSGDSVDFRQAVGLDPEDRLLLQPTRIVQRKSIEQSIELVRRLDDGRSKLVITHSGGDEGDAYERRVREYARLLGVPVIFAAPLIARQRGVGPDGKRRFTIWDAYARADLVTYPSSYEGFGNAFLEAVYSRIPIFSNRYAIYRTDIEPCGFRAILMDGFLTDDVVEQVRHVLSDDEYRREMVEHNYRIGKRLFSYSRAAAELRTLLSRPRLTRGEEVVSCGPVRPSS